MHTVLAEPEAASSESEKQAASTVGTLRKEGPGRQGGSCRYRQEWGQVRAQAEALLPAHPGKELIQLIPTEKGKQGQHESPEPTHKLGSSAQQRSSQDFHICCTVRRGNDSATGL